MTNILKHLSPHSFLQSPTTQSPQSTPTITTVTTIYCQFAQKGQTQSSHPPVTQENFHSPYKQTMNKTMRWEFLKPVESDEVKMKTNCPNGVCTLQKQEKNEKNVTL